MQKVVLVKSDTDTKYEDYVCQCNNPVKMKPILDYINRYIRQYKAVIRPLNENEIVSSFLVEDFPIQDLNISLTLNFTSPRETQTTPYMWIEKRSSYSFNVTGRFINFPLKQLKYYAEYNIEDKIRNLLTSYESLNLSNDEMRIIVMEYLPKLFKGVD